MVKRAETNAYWMLSPGGDSSPTPPRLRELQGRRGRKEGKAGGWEGVLRDAVFWYDMDNALTNSAPLWLSAQDLHKIKPIKLIARMGKVLMSSIPAEYHWC